MFKINISYDARRNCKKNVCQRKGILAADESTGTIAKDLKVSTLKILKNRLAFRETLFSSKAMKNYIGGVILFDEAVKLL